MEQTTRFIAPCPSCGTLVDLQIQRLDLAADGYETLAGEKVMTIIRGTVSVASSHRCAG